MPTQALGNEPRVAVGGEKLARDVGGNEAKEGKRSHKRRGNGDIKRDAHHQAPQGPFVVNAERHRLFAAEADDVKDGEVFLSHQAIAAKGAPRDDAGGVDVRKACRQGV